MPRPYIGPEEVDRRARGAARSFSHQPMGPAAGPVIIRFRHGPADPHHPPNRTEGPPPRPQGAPRTGAPPVRGGARTSAERDGVPAAAAERPLVRLDPPDVGAGGPDRRSAFRQAG